MGKPTDQTRVSDEPTPEFSDKVGEATRLSNPTPVSAAAKLTGSHPPAATSEKDLAETAHDAVRIEEELLREMKRMNHQLALVTTGYRRYTISFFSGIARGLGAAVGATVVFALFVAAFSRLDTTPLIGNYVKKIMTVAKNSGPTSGFVEAFASSPTPSAVDTATPAPSITAEASPSAAASAEPSVTPSPIASETPASAPAATPRPSPVSTTTHPKHR